VLFNNSLHLEGVSGNEGVWPTSVVQKYYYLVPEEQSQGGCNKNLAYKNLYLILAKPFLSLWSLYVYCVESHCQGWCYFDVSLSHFSLIPVCVGNNYFCSSCLTWISQSILRLYPIFHHWFLRNLWTFVDCYDVY